MTKLLILGSRDSMACSVVFLLATVVGASAFAPLSSAPPSSLQSCRICRALENGLLHTASLNPSAKSTGLLLRPVERGPGSAVLCKAGSAGDKGDRAGDTEDEEENTLAGSVLASGGGLPLSPEQKKAKAMLGDVGHHIPP